jgi:hypothetical protein
MPLHHLAYLYQHSFIVEFKAVKPTATVNELADFLLQDLQLPPLDVVSFYVDHAAQHLLVTVETEAVFQAALDRLAAGVAWAAAGGARTHGWAVSEALTSVRLSNVPPFLTTAALVDHMTQFGRVLHAQRGFSRLFPRAANGVVHLSMHLEDAAVLPGYLQLLDEQGNLAASLAVHTDGGRRVCYRCGSHSHVGQWCRATTRLPTAPPSLWSSLVITPAAAAPGPPKPAPQAAPAAVAASAAPPGPPVDPAVLPAPPLLPAAPAVPPAAMDVSLATPAAVAASAVPPGPPVDPAVLPAPPLLPAAPAVAPAAMDVSLAAPAAVAASAAPSGPPVDPAVLPVPPLLPAAPAVPPAATDASPAALAAPAAAAASAVLQGPLPGPSPSSSLPSSCDDALSAMYNQFTWPQATPSTPASSASSVRSRSRSRSRQAASTDDEWTPGSRSRGRQRQRRSDPSSPRPGGSRSGGRGGRGSSGPPGPPPGNPPPPPPAADPRRDVLTPPSQVIEDGSVTP